MLKFSFEGSSLIKKSNLKFKIANLKLSNLKLLPYKIIDYIIINTISRQVRDKVLKFKLGYFSNVRIAGRKYFANFLCRIKFGIRIKNNYVPPLFLSRYTIESNVHVSSRWRIPKMSGALARQSRDVTSTRKIPGSRAYDIIPVRYVIRLRAVVHSSRYLPRCGRRNAF